MPGRRVSKDAKHREAIRIQAILEALKESYPDATCALHFRNPFELLVATIL